MKEPEKLIRKYYADHGITSGAPLLFSYVKKSTTGGDWAIIEYYAARYGHVRGRRGKDIVTKLVMRFNPQTYRYSMSNSVIRYESYSSLAINHLLFDFHREMTGCFDYSNRCCKETGTNRMSSYGNWKYEVMPTSEIPLNDFTGTKYQYCKYRYKDEEICTGVHSYRYWGKNPYGNLPDYLRKFDLNPRAMEMFASLGLVQYMKDSFLIRLRDDWQFAAWYKKHAKETIGMTITQIQARARREIGTTYWLMHKNEERRLERLRKRKRLEREERIEMRKKREIEEKMAREREERADRIKNLYLTLKSICKKYGVYEVVVPRTEREMIQEGKKMHNCIGACYPMRQGIDSIILFFRKNGKPFVDVDVDPKTFRVRQCRLTCNADADEKMHKFAEEIAMKIKAIYDAA